MTLAIILLLLATFPVVMIAINWNAFAPLPSVDDDAAEPMSVLIPARNEEVNIELAVRSVLASEGVQFELIVMDDHSTDRTASIVESIAHHDPRVRLIAAPPLTAGWCGKQHACWALAKIARFDLLVWIDADVRLESQTLRRIGSAMRRSPVDLLSGFPRELTSGWLDALLIPLIHFVLLGYLPMRLMRQTNDPSISAGCGQLFVARRAGYEAAGGHETIRESMHDGVQLPRAFRRAGRSTDLFDATDAASCRMYSSARDTWNGLLKNAGEGMAAPRAIVPWTVLLLGGGVAPAAMTIALAAHRTFGIAFAMFAAAWLLQVLARLALALRFRQPLLSALLHPFGVAALLLIQFTSMIDRATGRKRTWKGRDGSPSATTL